MGVGLVCFQRRLFCPGDLDAILRQLCGCAWTLHSPSLSHLGANGLSRGSSGTPCTVLPPFPLFFFHSLLNLFFKYFSLFGCAGPCCGMQDLAVFMAAEWDLTGCGSWTLSCSRSDLVSWPGIESGPLHWEHRVLATWPPGSPEHLLFAKWLFEELIQVFSTPAPSPPRLFFPLTFSYWFGILFFWP